MEAEQLFNWLQLERFKLISFIGVSCFTILRLVSAGQQGEPALRTHTPHAGVSFPLRSAQR